MKKVKKLIVSAWQSIWNKKQKSNSMVGTPIIGTSGLDDTYLYDFKNYQSGYEHGAPAIMTTHGTLPSNEDTTPVGGTFFGSVDAKPDATPLKIKVKPKDVLYELETMPTPWSLLGLDKKIDILKEKERFIVQSYAKRDVTNLIERLQNRKHYPKYKQFFESFQNTDDAKIEKLLSKYELVMKTSDLFVPEFPDVAISTMKSYAEVVHKICGKKPVFYVIADEDKFRKAYEKRDPILLVQSPFGFYWQILGAWDEEMLLLSEL